VEKIDLTNTFRYAILVLSKNNLTYTKGVLVMSKLYYHILGISIDDVDDVKVLKTFVDKDEAIIEYQKMRPELVATIGEVKANNTKDKLYDIELIEVSQVTDFTQIG